MASSIAAGFIKGLTGSAIDQMEARTKAEREMEKARMLEKLRIETEKELTYFKESRPDYQERLRGEKITNDFNATKMEQDKELFPLELQSKRQTVAYQAEDQQMARESHADTLRTNATSRAASRARLDGSDSSGEGGKMNNTVYREYTRTFKELTDAGANPAELANYQTLFSDGVNSGRWNAKQQLVFLNQTRRNFTHGGTYGVGKLKGQKFGPRLETASTASLDAKLGK